MKRLLLMILLGLLVFGYFYIQKTEAIKIPFLEEKSKESNVIQTQSSAASNETNTTVQNTKTIDERILNFTEVWVWDYVDMEGNEETFEAYREPNLGYWLLPRTSLPSEPMIDWFMLKPNGEVLMAYVDPEWGSKPQIAKVQWNYERYQQLRDDYKMTNDYQTFGRADLGFPEFKGRAHTLSIATYMEPSIVYIASTDADLTPLYQFNWNNVGGDAQLPFEFPPAMPGNMIALSQTVHYGGRAPYSYSYNFRYISHAEYYINLEDYKH